MSIGELFFCFKVFVILKWVREKLRLLFVVGDENGG